MNNIEKNTPIHQKLQKIAKDHKKIPKRDLMTGNDSIVINTRNTLTRTTRLPRSNFLKGGCWISSELLCIFYCSISRVGTDICDTHDIREDLSEDPSICCKSNTCYCDTQCYEKSKSKGNSLKKIFFERHICEDKKIVLHFP